MTKTIAVVYVNGDKDTINTTYLESGNHGIFFYDGCLYNYHFETKYDSPYKGCIKCGIRDYKVIGHKEIVRSAW